MFRRRRTFGRRFGVRRRMTMWEGSIPFVATADRLPSTAFTAFPAPHTASYAEFPITLDDQQGAIMATVGGEGAVVLRVVGEVYLWNPTHAAAGTDAFLVVAMYRTTMDQVGGVYLPKDLWTANGMDDEDIMFRRVVHVPSGAVTPGANDIASWQPGYTQFDVKVKRRVMSNERVVFSIQSFGPAGSRVDAVSIAGGYRVLRRRHR